MIFMSGKRSTRRRAAIRQRSLSMTSNAICPVGINYLQCQTDYSRKIYFIIIVAMKFGPIGRWDSQPAEKAGRSSDAPGLRCVDAPESVEQRGCRPRHQHLYVAR